MQVCSVVYEGNKKGKQKAYRNIHIQLSRKIKISRFTTAPRSLQRDWHFLPSIVKKMKRERISVDGWVKKSTSASKLLDTVSPTRLTYRISLRVQHIFTTLTQLLHIKSLASLYANLCHLDLVHPFLSISFSNPEGKVQTLCGGTAYTWVPL